MSIAENRRAFFEYEIGERYEAGLVLLGTEVKSMRDGRVSIAESYISIKDGEAWLVNAHVDLLQGNKMGNIGGHQPRRQRKLLLRSREIANISARTSRSGMTAVPLSLYFNIRGVAKLAFALGQGRKTRDKRAAIKEREWKRDKARLMSIKR